MQGDWRIYLKTAYDVVDEPDEKQSDDPAIKPYDESKTNELWKTFGSSAKAPVETTVPKSAPEVPKKVCESPVEKVTTPTNPSAKRPAPSSTSLLDRLGIGKKAKLSTLEKTRLDWSAHKESESLTEDLESHRRGKDSYVERKAFLQRSEVREHDHFLHHVKKK